LFGYLECSCFKTHSWKKHWYM